MSAQIQELDHLGLPAVRLETKRGACAIISLVGGHVLSWQPTSGGERIFLSPSAVLDGTTPIRGGVPVCFPQFAEQGRLPKHGLLRSRRWEIKERRSEDSFAMVTLRVSEDDESYALWPNAFNCELTVLVEDERLDLEFEVENTGHGSFVFTGALHTYLAVREVEEVALEGLYGIHYSDKTTGKDRIRETGEAVHITEETDRIYRDATRPLTLRERGHELAIRAEGFPDVVVWNPWVEKCAALADMGPLDFRRMLCVEAAITRPTELPAGESWWGRQSLVAIA